MKKQIISTLLFASLCLPSQASVVLMKQKIKPAQPALPVQINCDYKIPVTTKSIDESLVLIWAQRAAMQSFDLDSAAIQPQLDKLEACYTVDGWKEYKEAMVRSGNIVALQENKLNMTSRIVGQVQLSETQAGQWRVQLPLEVVYQNQKARASQKLDINLTIGRKPSGDLGIVHLVATLVSTK